MKVSKLGFSIVDYAKRNNMGIGSFRLKDGSSIKVLQNLDKKAVEFFQVKNGKLLGAKGYRGNDAQYEAVNFFCGFEKLAEKTEEMDKAWSDSLKNIDYFA